MKLFVTICILLLGTLAARAQEVHTNQPDDPFAGYSISVPWQEERFTLENYGIAFRRNPDSSGVIRFFTAGKDSITKIRKRAIKAGKYVLKEFKIDPTRLEVQYGGTLGHFSTIELNLKDSSHNLK